MFKLAHCEEFISLREKYIDRLPPNIGCCLKDNGKVFILDQLIMQKPARILEVGGGLDPYFSDQFSKNSEYWMIDSGSLYPDPEDHRRRAKSVWQAATLVDSLLGDFSPDLPDNHFDFLFSISALEHTPRSVPSKIQDICRDMFRVLKPGGLACHTIDQVAIDTIAMQYRAELLAAGFVFVNNPQPLDWNVGSRASQVLLESIETVITSYYRKWRESGHKIYDYHFGSVQVIARKPV